MGEHLPIPRKNIGKFIALVRNISLATGAIVIAEVYSPAAFAEEEAYHSGGIFSFVLENDLFANTDRHYTNGARFSWLTAEGKEPDWLEKVGKAFPMFYGAKDIRVAYALGQNMYTPRNIARRNPNPDDQPYAGWLYGSVGLIGETGSRLDQLLLTLGVVGPASGAEPTQKFVHRITGSTQPQGWDEQLKNEPTAQLTYERSWRALASGKLWGFSADATPHAGAALGNVFIYANTGLTFRFGQNLPNDYGTPRIQPSLPGSGFFRPVETFGWYLFAGVDGRAVGRNIFLDGNSFRDGPSVDRKIFVGDAQAGLAIIWNDIRFAYTHVLRTKEFREQRDITQFGAFSVSLQF